VRLESVGKRYGLAQPWIVRDVSLDIPAGRLIRLEGRNGSGKSTLLRVLAGACRPSTGRVTGRPAVGYVPERFPPGLPFSPREYLTHLGRIQGMAGPGLAAQVDRGLERLGAAEYARAPMRTLSKGMCQKVAVAQALLPRPGLLVLDEAWTGLDQGARGVLDDAVAQRLADGTAVVYVDHDQQRLAGLRPERWLVAAGQVVPAGAAAAAGAPVTPDLEAGRAATPAAVIIEVTGAGEAPAVAALPGVRSVRAAGERLVVTVAAADSDEVLRRLLAAGPAAHVRSVGPGEAAP
jgi:ABC-2 type transport system ATP-binding protein